MSKHSPFIAGLLIGVLIYQGILRLGDNIGFWGYFSGIIMFMLLLVFLLDMRDGGWKDV